MPRAPRAGRECRHLKGQHLHRLDCDDGRRGEAVVDECHLTDEVAGTDVALSRPRALVVSAHLPGLGSGAELPQLRSSLIISASYYER